MNNIVTVQTESTIAISRTMCTIILLFADKRNPSDSEGTIELHVQISDQNIVSYDLYTQLVLYKIVKLHVQLCFQCINKTK